MPQPPSQLSVSEARDQLGTLVEHVATTGARVRLTHYGHPAGVLVSLDENLRNLQMSLGGAHGVTDAVTRWATVREAARAHPQALVLPSRGMAVLLGPELAYRLDHGHPPLPADSVAVIEGEFVDQDGNLVPPGTYSLGDQVVTLSADTTEAIWAEESAPRQDQEENRRSDKQPIDAHYPTTIAWQQGGRAYVRASYGSEVSTKMENFARAAWDTDEQAWWVDMDQVHLVLTVLNEAREDAANEAADKMQLLEKLGRKKKK